MQLDGSAEFAVVIAARARRRGVAASLFGTIVMQLRCRGISRLVAMSLGDNGPFTRFATACGMKSEPPDGEGIVAWALDLTTDRAVARWSRLASARSMVAG